MFYFLLKSYPNLPFLFANYLDIETEECIIQEGIMKSWDPVHLKKYAWYLDCPLKTPFTFDIALLDFIQPALKGATKVVSTIMNENVTIRCQKNVNLRDQSS